MEVEAFYEMKTLMGLVLCGCESNGKFSLQLPDGEYTVFGLWSSDTGSIDLQVQFTSQNGELVNPLVVTLPNHY